MASTTFTDGVTPIVASWLNDINSGVYTGNMIQAASYVFGSTETRTITVAGAPNPVSATRPAIYPTGSTASISLILGAKGANGGIIFQTGVDTTPTTAFQVGGSGAGSGDFVNVQSTSAGNVIFSASGASANVDIQFSPRGTGTVLIGNSMRFFTAGAGITFTEATNGKQGMAVLVAGTRTVANTSITANSRIQLTSQVDGGTPGWLRVSSRVVGTSFTITSSSATDTSTVAYTIFEGV